MKTSVNVQIPVAEQLLEVAKRFPKGFKFVVCDSNKTPLNYKWEGRQQDVAWIERNLENLKNKGFASLGLILDKNLVLDLDGSTAIRDFKEVCKTLDVDFESLKQTLTMSSNPDERLGLIFNYPLNQGKLKYKCVTTVEGEKIELRTGTQYQIVAGVHPLTAVYLTNFAEMVALPLPIYEWWKELLQVASEKKKNRKGDVDIDLADIAASAPKDNESSEEETTVSEESEEVVDIYLPMFLSRRNRFAYQEGIKEHGCQIEEFSYSGRNRAGFELACELIGIQEWLLEFKENNKKYKINLVGDAEKYFNEFVNRCKPKIDSSEAASIWNSADSKNRDTVMDEEIFLYRLGIGETEKDVENNEEVCKKLGISQVSLKKGVKVAKSGKVEKRNNLPGDRKTMAGMINDYLAKNSETSVEEIDLATDSMLFQFGRVHPTFRQTFRKMVEEAIKKHCSINEKEQFGNAIRNIAESRQFDFQASEVVKGLPLGAETLNDALENDNPLGLSVTAWLTTLSATIGNDLRFNWNKAGMVSATVFTLFKGDPASGKSRISGRYISALEKLQECSDRQNYYLKNIYDGEIADIQSTPIAELREFAKQEVVKRGLDIESNLIDTMSKRKIRELLIIEPEYKPTYIISNATKEGIAKETGDSPEFHNLICPDEIVTLFSKINPKNPKTGGEELCDMYGNKLTKITTASKQVDYKPSSYKSSVLSTIQTERFPKYFDIKDSSGLLSRFILLNVPHLLMTYGEASPNSIQYVEDLKNMILGFQKWQKETLYTEYEETRTDGSIEKLKEALVIKQTKETREIFANFATIFQNDKRTAYSDYPSVSAWMSRLPENVARLSLTIHLLSCYECHLKGTPYEVEFMTKETMEKAIHLGYMFESEYQKANEIFFNQENKTISSDDENEYFLLLKKSIEYCEKKNSTYLTVDEVKSHFFCAERKWVVEQFKISSGKRDEKRKRLNITEVISVFQDLADKGLGEFDKKSRVFTPNFELIKGKSKSSVS